MRQLFIAAVLAAVAGALASCDPRPLVVLDNSALKSITLQVNNDNPKWEFGEERIFTVAVNPATAICERFELKASNPEIVVIRGGELPNQFKVTADGEGKVVLTATAMGHDGNEVKECSDVMEFTLVDNRVKPTRPVLTVNVAPGTDLNAKKVLSEDTAFVTDDGLDLVLTVSCDEARAMYSLKAEDTKMLTVERTGSESWMLKTAKPGRTWLRMTVTDGYGNPFEYAFLMYVFGHLDMTAEFIPLSGDAGFFVAEHTYLDLTAQVYMAGELFGWPWNDANNVESVTLPAYSGTLDISSTFVYDDIMSYKEQMDYLYGLDAGTAYNPAPFTPHKAKLNYIITLSNPYILIKLWDDSNLEEPRWFNFWTEGVLQQNGVAKVEHPEEILRSAQNDGGGGRNDGGRGQNDGGRGQNDGGSNQNDGGWAIGNEYTIPL